MRSGDVLAEIETDKATMEVEAVDDGRLGKILVPEGTQGIKVNQPIALLLGEGEDASSLAKSSEPPPARTAAPATPPASADTPPQVARPATARRERRMTGEFLRARWRAAWRSKPASISPR